MHLAFINKVNKEIRRI